MEHGEEFEIISVDDGDSIFNPYFSPSNIRPSKERKLQRNSATCGDEAVADNGAKNIEVMVTGKFAGRDERDNFLNLLELGEVVKLISGTITKNVFVRDGEYEGVVGRTQKNGKIVEVWDYTLHFVSSGNRKLGEMIEIYGTETAPRYVQQADYDALEDGPE